MTVTISGQAGTDLTLNSSTLTFTTSDWDTAQTVTVTAAEDADATDDTEVTARPASLTFTSSNWDTKQTVTISVAQDDEAATVTHSAASTDADYNGIDTDDVDASVEDDKTATITPSKTSLDVDEGDADGSAYTVKLAVKPTADVTVTISGHADTDLTLDQTELTFTTSNWDTAQTVTVAAGGDRDATDDTEKLTHSASGAGEYQDVETELAVNVQDDESAAIILSDNALSMAEQDSAGVTYTVKLAAKPTDDVTLTISGTRERRPVTGQDVPDLHGRRLEHGPERDRDRRKRRRRRQRHRHPEPYGQRPGRVRRGEEGTAGDRGRQRRPGGNSEPGGGDGGRGSHGHRHGGPQHETLGGRGRNDSGPDGQHRGDLEPGIPDLHQGQLEHGPVGDRSRRPRQRRGGDAATVTHTTASTDASYDGLAVSNADITVTDDDTAGVTVSPKKISIIAGRTNSYTMKLTAQPTASVTTTITIPADAEITLDKSSLTFTTTTCNTAQKITVTAADNAARAQVTLTHTVSGGDYGTVTADDMTVKVLPPPSTQTIQVGVTTGAQSLAVPEGGTAKYSLVLSSEPSADATITATLPTGNDLSLDKTTLTFAEDNWDTAQELTLSAAEDDDTVTDPRDRPGRDHHPRRRRRGVRQCRGPGRQGDHHGERHRGSGPLGHLPHRG